MPARLDVPIGTVFGQWTVVGDRHYNTPRSGGRRQVVVPCACSCGRTTKDVMFGHLRSGASTRCSLCGFDSGVQMAKLARALKAPALAVGTRFGNRVTTGPVFLHKGRRSVPMVCDVGHESVIALTYLVGRGTGCRTCALASVGTHRESKTRLYRVWSGMMTRCTNPNRATWSRYGGRGIRVCEEWQTWENFRDWALATGYVDDGLPRHQDSLTIDRINVDGNYEPGNCEWVSFRENTRRMREDRSRRIAAKKAAETDTTTRSAA